MLMIALAIILITEYVYMFGRDAHLTPTDIFYIIEIDKFEFVEMIRWSILQM